MGCPMKKILMDCSSASQDTGGNIQLCLSLSNIAALDKSIELSIIANSYLIKLLSEEARQRVVQVSMRPASSFLAYINWRNNTKKTIKRIGPDFIIIPYGPYYANFNIPTIQGFAEPWQAKSHPRYLKGCSTLEIIKNFLRKKVQIYFYKRSSLLWAETESSLKHFCALANYSVENTEVISNSVPAAVSKIVPKRSSWSTSRNRPFRLLYVSAPYKHKNHKLIIDILEKYPSLNVEFYVTLPNGHPNTKMLTENIKKSRLCRKVINYGFVSPNNLESVYENCDAVFMPSIAEVFSATYLEGMHFCRPVICSDLSFAREVMGEAGIYFDPWSIESAYEKIVLCMTNSLTYESAVERGSQRITRFDSSEQKYRKIRDMISRFNAG
jgi:glycosyltransferase involved in cell wall biosynthesis